MSDMNRDASLSPGAALIDEQAHQWFAIMRSDTFSQDDLAAHRAWLDADLRHQKAYRELESLWDMIGDYRDQPEVRALRQTALAEREPVNESGPPRRSRRQTLGLSLAVAASLIIAVLVLRLAPGQMTDALWGILQDTDYRTDIGEQRTVKLTDGSKVVLDTQTHIVTDFTEQARRVFLHAGQASFDVAKDANRPFIVITGKGKITALGTFFVVRMNEDRVLVTLIEGRVEVAKVEPSLSAPDTSEQGATSDIEVLQLEAGQQVALMEEGISSAQQASLEQATGWQKGRLVFDDTPLEDVIDDLNRYSRQKILVGDESIKTIRVTGVFKSGDNDRAIKAFKSYFSLKVTRDSNGNLVLLPSKMPSAG